MSLIFEALKKLEREKQAPERGILVVGPSQWAGSDTRVRLGVVVAGAVALVALGVVIGALLRRPAQEPATPAAAAPAATPAAAAPVTTPAATLDLGPAPASRPAAPAPVVAPRPDAPPVAPRAGATARPEAAKPQDLTLTLQAVTEQDGVPVALINDRLMRVGDAFEGVKVLSIAAGAVEVEIEATGERRVLSF